MAKVAKSGLNRAADTGLREPMEKENQSFVGFGLFHCYVFYVCKRDEHKCSQKRSEKV